MSEWKEYKLGEYSNVLSGFAFKANEFNSYGTPVLKIKNVSSGLLKMDDLQYYPFELNEKLKKYVIKKGDILIAMTGSHAHQPSSMVGRTCRYDLETISLLNQRVGKIYSKDKSKLNEDFLFYFFKQDYIPFELATSAGGSANQANISPDQIKELSILLPPLPEQTAIAEVLSSLDDKIDLLHRQNKTLEQLAETLFRQWFVEEVEESWEETALDKHTEVFRGLSYKGSGLTDVGNGLPMHNLNSVYEFGGYKQEGIKFYKGEYRERHLVNVGDIIITNTEQGHEHRLIGFPGIVPGSFGDIGLFSQHIYKLIPLKSSFLTREFIYYLLMTPSVREQIIGATNGSTVNMLAIDGLQRPTFKLPPKEKVELFTENVKNYWRKKNLNNTQIHTLTQLRDSLLPKLMNGEVRAKS